MSANCPGFFYMTSSRGDGAFGPEGHRRAIYICMLASLSSPELIIVRSDSGRLADARTRDTWMPVAVLGILAAAALGWAFRFVIRRRTAAGMAVDWFYASNPH